MPLFDYQCQACEIKEERITNAKTEAEDIQICAECGDIMVRQLPVAAIHFKGQCWAKDNYSSAVNKGG